MVIAEPLGLGHIEFVYIIFDVSSLFSVSLLPIYDISFWNYDKQEETGSILFCIKSILGRNEPMSLATF